MVSCRSDRPGRRGGPGGPSGRGRNGPRGALSLLGDLHWHHGWMMPEMISDVSMHGGPICSVHGGVTMLIRQAWLTRALKRNRMFDDEV